MSVVTSAVVGLSFFVLFSSNTPANSTSLWLIVPVKQKCVSRSSAVSKALRPCVEFTDRRTSDMSGVQECELKVLILNINIAQYL